MPSDETESLVMSSGRRRVDLQRMGAVKPGDQQRSQFLRRPVPLAIKIHSRAAEQLRCSFRRRDAIVLVPGPNSLRKHVHVLRLEREIEIDHIILLRVAAPG